ncbi:hypothetical protein [Nocardia gipuzkoensis]|uniref:hypothetical protein n=1 Tax=Nocardia gipuzkoensis TaxID=2749991 RepID=UPI00237D37C8|nr:hypothetical protein [Nocardia gipuzkoensis]MDE1672424.1 hypothetical protein [Nocardia gipuzkoensis]
MMHGEPDAGGRHPVAGGQCEARAGRTTSARSWSVMITKMLGRAAGAATASAASAPLRAGTAAAIIART